MSSEDKELFNKYLNKLKTTVPILKAEDIQNHQNVGNGSFGAVFKGTWNGKDVAVKEIKDPEKNAFPFLKEVEYIAKADHKNIVKLYGACLDPFSIVMEYADGGSLHKLLHEDPKPYYKMQNAMSWSLQCAEGVAYLHSLRVIHRDLKPLNLILLDFGRHLKICDFGTVRDIHTEMTKDPGTTIWTAPEMYAGTNYNEKVDVFSWGLIMCEIIVRKLPSRFVNPTTKEMTQPERITNVPIYLSELLNSCWEKEPDKRPSMTKVVETLQEHHNTLCEPIDFDGDELRALPNKCQECFPKRMIDCVHNELNYLPNILGPVHVPHYLLERFLNHCRTICPDIKVMQRN